MAVVELVESLLAPVLEMPDENFVACGIGGVFHKT
jgi:hypothetical protein